MRAPVTGVTAAALATCELVLDHYSLECSTKWDRAFLECMVVAARDCPAAHDCRSSILQSSAGSMFATS